MTHDEMIAVIQARKEGKTIESRARGIGGTMWVPLNEEPSWQFSEYDYRIKFEPFKKEFEIYAEQRDNKSWSIDFGVYDVPTAGKYKITIEELSQNV